LDRIIPDITVEMPITEHPIRSTARICRSERGPILMAALSKLARETGETEATIEERL
jgi:hypothetical protein